ncbi:hypothetical protein LTR62_006771 [Meristemomyces frigidus]|uniref:Uncharacterized protein n=1 Tax=Meristemomyces frigidus TaxID=1508187 RepID=A0AAN7YRZ3_9PEZI|nr:hypothetical protein LTR62_006771 [Meristemomyces frigidus]
MADSNNLFPHTLDMPSYFIYRDTPLGPAFDPAAQPIFFPAKDSDELFDALRIAFPHVKSHSERMRDAMIKFLLEERLAEQAHNAIAETAAATPAMWQQSWPSMSSSGTSSSWSSPEALDLATPTFGLSPGPMAPPPLTRQYSTAPSVTTASYEPTSPAALEDMTGVFSISATGQPKQKIRRKMTEAEKVEYRIRRTVKACDKCAKRKRKCTHNQPAMESAASKQKVTKPRQTVSPTLPQQQVQQGLLNLDDYDFDGMFDNDMQLFDDFTTGLDDPINVSEYAQQKACGHNSFGIDATSVSPQIHQFSGLPDLGPLFDSTLISANVPHGPGAGAQLASQTTLGYSALANAVHSTRETTRRFAAATLLADADCIRNDCHPRHLVSTINNYGKPQGMDGHGEQQSSGNQMLWEHLRTGQHEPTHNEAMQKFLADFVNQEAKGMTGGSGGSAGPIQQQRDNQGGGRKTSPNMQSELAAEGPLEGMAIGDYLRMKINFDNMDHPMGRGGQALPSMIPVGIRAKKPAGTPSSAGGEGPRLASTSVLVKQIGSLYKEESETHDEGRPAFAFGESIDRAASPSAELYRLKRRIPKSLHSIVASTRRSSATTQASRTVKSGDFFDWDARKDAIGTYQAIGAAHQQLDTDNYVRSIPRPSAMGDKSRESYQEVADNISNSQTPHTPITARPAVLNPSNSGSSNIRLNLLASPGPAAHITTTLPPATDHSDTGDQSDAAADTLQQRRRALQVSPASMRASETNEIVYVAKKRDTFRRRDHFGRVEQMQQQKVEAEPQQSPSLASGTSRAGGFATGLLTVMACILLLSTCSASTNLDFSLLCMALFTPAHGIRGSKTLSRCLARYSHVYGTMLENIKACYLLLVLEGRSGSEDRNDRKVWGDGDMVARWGRCGGAFPRFWDALAFDWR